MTTGYLRRFSKFDALTDADVALLERVLVVSDYPSGHVFVREGDHANARNAATWLLLEGEVGVVAAAPEGGWGVQRVMGPGEFVGILALLVNIRRSTTCTANGHVVAAKLDRATLDELFRRDTGVHIRFQMLIARQLAADLRRLGTLMTASLRAAEATDPAQG